MKLTQTQGKPSLGISSYRRVKLDKASRGLSLKDALNSHKTKKLTHEEMMTVQGIQKATGELIMW